MTEIFKNDNDYIANTYGRLAVAFVSGNGSFLYDENGKEYIDFGTGIAVNGLGIGFEPWKNAVVEQLNKIPHASNLYYTEPCVKLAEKLCKRTGMKKVFFGNSGAEANECAIKAARKYSFDKYGENRNKIITLKNSFHGRTVTTLSATGQDNFHKYFMPFTEGFLYADANDFNAIENLADGTVCAIILEIVQGEGGVKLLDADYIENVAKLCEKEDIILIIDEVQTGNGRTGTLYAYMDYGISPDIVTTAKGLGNGLPIGATMFNAKCEYTLKKSDHGSTFGGNPIACAGACAVLDSLNDNLLKGVKDRSEYIINALSPLPAVKKITGKGLMLGIETENAGEKVKECLKKGLVVLTAKDKIRLLPALNIDYDTLNRGLNILKEVLQ